MCVCVNIFVYVLHLQVLNRAQCQHRLVSGGTYNIQTSAITESASWTTNPCFSTARARLNTRHTPDACPTSPYYLAGGWAPSKHWGYWWIQADFGRLLTTKAYCVSSQFRRMVTLRGYTIIDYNGLTQLPLFTDLSPYFAF